MIEIRMKVEELEDGNIKVTNQGRGEGTPKEVATVALLDSVCIKALQAGLGGEVAFPNGPIQYKTSGSSELN